MKKSSLHLFALYYPGVSAWVAGSSYTIKDRSFSSRVTKVLRLQVGEALILFDDDMHAKVQLESIARSSLSIQVQSIEKNSLVQPAITLGVGLLKKNAFEQVTYFAAQLGVRKLVPLLTEKSRSDWDGDKERDRLASVMIAAREQAKSFNRPELALPCSLEAFLDAHKADQESGCNFYFDAKGQPFKTALGKQTSNVTLLFGPEGGFSSEEMSLFETHGFVCCALTPTILRSPEAVLLGTGALISLSN